MGFIVAGVNTREIKRADKHNLTLLSKSAYYPSLHHSKRTIDSGTRKHVSSDHSTDRPTASVKKHRRSNTEHTETTTEAQSRQNCELVVPSHQQSVLVKSILEFPDEIIDQIMIMCGTNSNLPIINKQLYAYFNQSATQAIMMNQYIKYNYTRDEGDTMAFDLRVFNCKRCREYLMDVGLVLPTETETDAFKRTEAMNYIFNKPITRFINDESTRKDPKLDFEVPFLVENIFPEYFLKNEGDFHKYFVPYLKDTTHNVVLEVLMDKSPAKILLNHPETVINMLIGGITNEDQISKMLMKVRNLAISETDLQNMSNFHLSAAPLVLAVQRHGRSKNKIQSLLQSLLDLYIQTSNKESLSDDSLWALLIADSELQLSNEMIWNAGGRPSAAVMNNSI